MILLSGVAASWLSTASRESINQVLVIILVTGTIGFTQLHHIITGSIAGLAGVFAGQGVWLSIKGYFLLWTTPGNIPGGVIMAGLVI